MPYFDANLGDETGSQILCGVCKRRWTNIVGEVVAKKTTSTPHHAAR
jgi:hypothetical protein